MLLQYLVDHQHFSKYEYQTLVGTKQLDCHTTYSDEDRAEWVRLDQKELKAGHTKISTRRIRGQIAEKTRHNFESIRKHLQRVGKGYMLHHLPSYCGDSITVHMELSTMFQHTKPFYSLDEGFRILGIGLHARLQGDQVWPLKSGENGKRTLITDNGIDEYKELLERETEERAA